MEHEQQIIYKLHELHKKSMFNSQHHQCVKCEYMQEVQRAQKKIAK